MTQWVSCGSFSVNWWMMYRCRGAWHNFITTVTFLPLYSFCFRFCQLGSHVWCSYCVVHAGTVVVQLSDDSDVAYFCCCVIWRAVSVSVQCRLCTAYSVEWLDMSVTICRGHLVYMSDADWDGYVVNNALLWQTSHLICSCIYNTWRLKVDFSILASCIMHCYAVCTELLSFGCLCWCQLSLAILKLCKQRNGYTVVIRGGRNTEWDWQRCNWMAYVLSEVKFHCSFC